MAREDRFTTTEHDAGLYEAHHGESDDAPEPGDREASFTGPKAKIVLDLTRSQVSLLGHSLSRWIEWTSLTVEKRAITDLLEQIEEQVKPPRIPEPNQIGSLVKAAQVGECDGSERVWVRFSRVRTDCWIDSLSHQRSWSDLDNPQSYPFGGRVMGEPS